MATTSSGLPYPLPTDPIAGGADAIKALAEGVDARYVMRGTTAQRDARWGAPPGTDAAAVTLANQTPLYFNTEKGYLEAYYAKTGLAGLTVPGLIATQANGWYPRNPGAMFAHKGRTGGAQTNAAANTEYEVALDNSQILRGGITDKSPSRLAVPVGGYYRATVRGYWTGLGVVVNAQFVYPRINGLAPNPNPAETAYAAVYGRPAGVDARGTGMGLFLLAANDDVSLWWGATSAGVAIWGNNGYNGTFLELEYFAPPLVNGVA